MPRKFIREADDGDYSYRMNHRPATAEDGAPFHQLNGNEIYPDDVYDHPRYYGDTKSVGFKESWPQILRARGNPEAMVDIYRSGPSSAINPGDWVSPSSSYARGNGLDPTDSGKDMPVWHQKVPAKYLHTSGDALEEYGYNGPSPLTGTKVSSKISKRWDPNSGELSFTHRPPSEEDTDDHVIAHLNGQQVGFLQLEPKAGKSQQFPPGTINMINVNSKYRGKGLARAMVEHAYSIGLNPIHSPLVVSPEGRSFRDKVELPLTHSREPEQEQMSLFGKQASYADYVKSLVPDDPERSQRYVEGTPGAYVQHRPGDPWPHVGWIQTDKLTPYADHIPEGSDPVTSALASSFKEGEGFIDPIHMYYNPDAGKAVIGEGNHRLAAALQAGLSHVPVTIHPMNDPSNYPNAQNANFQRKIKGDVAEQMHPGSVLPVNWLHGKDVQAKLREQGIPEEKWPVGLRTASKR